MLYQSQIYMLIPWFSEQEVCEIVVRVLVEWSKDGVGIFCTSFNNKMASKKKICNFPLCKKKPIENCKQYLHNHIGPEYKLLMLFKLYSKYCK